MSARSDDPFIRRTRCPAQNVSLKPASSTPKLAPSFALLSIAFHGLCMSIRWIYFYLKTKLFSPFVLLSVSLSLSLFVWRRQQVSFGVMAPSEIVNTSEFHVYERALYKVRETTITLPLFSPKSVCHITNLRHLPRECPEFIACRTCRK